MKSTVRLIMKIFMINKIIFLSIRLKKLKIERNEQVIFVIFAQKKITIERNKRVSLVIFCVKNPELSETNEWVLWKDNFYISSIKGNNGTMFLSTFDAVKVRKSSIDVLFAFYYQVGGVVNCMFLILEKYSARCVPLLSSGGVQKHSSWESQCKWWLCHPRSRFSKSLLSSWEWE